MDRLKLITAPSAAPIVSRDDAKLYCSIALPNTYWDELIDDLLADAAIAVEDALGRSIGTQTWSLFLDDFPAGGILLPRGPVTAVTWVKYYDTADAQQTLSDATYAVDLVSDPQAIVLVDGASWPTVDIRRNAVEVRFVAGANASSAPAEVAKFCAAVAGEIKRFVAIRFEDRTAPVPNDFCARLDAWRAGWFAA